MLYLAGPPGLAGEVGTQSGQQQYQEGFAEVKAFCSPGMRPSQSSKYHMQPRIAPIVLACSWGMQEDPEGGCS